MGVCILLCQLLVKPFMQLLCNVYVCPYPTMPTACKALSQLLCYVYVCPHPGVRASCAALDSWFIMCMRVCVLFCVPSSSVQVIYLYYMHPQHDPSILSSWLCVRILLCLLLVKLFIAAL